MALAQEDINYIKAHLPEWLPKQVHSSVVYDLELRERVVRVEDELKHQRELIREGFERMDKRFEAIDKRFESVDKRFETVDKRFEKMQESMDKRFEGMDKRFEGMNQRFEGMNQRLERFMIWSFATTITVGGIVIAAMKYLP